MRYKVPYEKHLESVSFTGIQKVEFTGCVNKVQGRHESRNYEENPAAHRIENGSANQNQAFLHSPVR